MIFPQPSPALGNLKTGVDANTLVLVHFDGTAGSTTFTNSGNGGNTVTAVAGAQVAVTNKRFGTGSLILDGVDDAVVISDSAALDFGTGNFTIDWWEYRTGSGGYPTCRDNNSFAAWIVLGNSVYMSSNGSSHDIANGQILGASSLNNWRHRAIVRSGNTFYTFDNGVQAATWSSSASLFASAGAVRIGSGQGGADFFPGYIDEFRISNVARWTSNFNRPWYPNS